MNMHVPETCVTSIPAPAMIMATRARPHRMMVFHGIGDGCIGISLVGCVGRSPRQGRAIARSLPALTPPRAAPWSRCPILAYFEDSIWPGCGQDKAGSPDFDDIGRFHLDIRVTS